MTFRTFMNDDAWLEEIMRRLSTQHFSRGNTFPSAAPKQDFRRAFQAAHDTRRMTRTIIQMAITLLDAAEEKQAEAERLLEIRLAADEEKYRAEMLKSQQRYAEKERRKGEERRRQAELEEMCRTVERLQLQLEEKEQRRIQEEKRRDAERQATNQKAAAALKHAQAEARRYREAAERAEQEAARAQARAERAEEAKRKYAARAESEKESKGQREESAAWSRYIQQWDLFKRFAFVAGERSGGVFRFEDIPWPMVSSPTSPGMITKGDVAIFLYSSFSGQGNSLKARIRELLLVWHPDKFGRWMRFVLEKDRQRVDEGVAAVARAGNEILAEYASRRNTL